MKEIKILFITHYTELYGANMSLLCLIDGLSTSKYIKVLLIVPALGKITEEAEKRNIEYHVIPFYNEIHFGKRSRVLSLIANGLKDSVKFLINWWLVLRNASKLKEYDIIHSNSSATLVGAYWAFILKKNHVWHIREFGWDDYEIVYNFGYGYFQYWLNKSSAVLSISKAIYDKRVFSSNVDLKPVVYNGVISLAELEINRRKLVERLKGKSNKIVFAIVGVLSKVKKQLEAIRAFHLFHNQYAASELLIVGSGQEEYRQELEDYIRKHNLERVVILLGYQRSMTEIYEKIDCLLMCSENEAFGRVTVEAMAFGSPVIGYNNAGTAEIIQDGYNGFIYLHGYKDLFEKMRSVLRNEQAFSELKFNAIESAGQFTIEKYTESIHEIYLQVLTVTDSFKKKR